MGGRLLAINPISVSAVSPTEDNQDRPHAAGNMLPLVYDELRCLAAAKLAHEPPGHTLQATALGHEAFVKLSTKDRRFNDREHFFACVAEAMRQILVDAARRRKTVKHGGTHTRQSMVDDFIASPYPAAELLQIDEALNALREQDEQLMTVVKLRCFAGMTHSEIGDAMELTRRQVDRLWAYARAGTSVTQFCDDHCFSNSDRLRLFEQIFGPFSTHTKRESFTGT